MKRTVGNDLGSNFFDFFTFTEFMNQRHIINKISHVNFTSHKIRTM